MCSPAALKVILVCFERQLDSQWYWLSLQVKEMALRKVGGLALWDFLDFIVRTRIPIFVLLRPFIQCKVSQPLAAGRARPRPAQRSSLRAALPARLWVCVGTDCSRARPENPLKPSEIMRGSSWTTLKSMPATQEL